MEFTLPKIGVNKLARPVEQFQVLRDPTLYNHKKRFLKL